MQLIEDFESKYFRNCTQKTAKIFTTALNHPDLWNLVLTIIGWLFNQTTLLCAGVITYESKFLI